LVSQCCLPAADFEPSLPPDSYNFYLGRQLTEDPGFTSKGPWRSSKTPGIQLALSNAYLKAEGLASLRDGWIKLHHSR
tara:strand:+ start:1282 stop:1515 length:234 start_codon:yes stop_codon:yes gene_type:complete